MKYSTKTVLAFNLIFIVLASIFGNNLLKNGSFYILIAINLFAFLLDFCLGEKIIKLPSKCSTTWFWMTVAFTFLIISYIILSFFGFFTLAFDLTDLGYSSEFIPRHAYIILMFPYVYIIAKGVYKTTIVERFFSKPQIVIVLLSLSFFLLSLVVLDTVIIRAISFTLATTLLVRSPRNILSIGLMAVFAFTFNPGSSTSWLAFGVAIAALVGYPYIKKLWLALGNTKSLLIIAAVIFIFAFYGNYVEARLSDINALWRWQYWMNEFDTLKKTNFLGAGFGTAYASESIYSEINGPHVFWQETSVAGAGVYVIAQHNSLMNFLYRLGVPGFYLALESMAIQPITWFFKIESALEEQKKSCIKWLFVNLLYNLVVITVNCGLESPRYAIMPCTVLGAFIGLLFKYDTASLHVSVKTDSEKYRDGI